MRLTKIKIISIFNKHIINYPTPSTLNYLWSFGFLGGLFLSIQLVTGIFLAMHYSVHINYAFYSIEHIIRNVPGGWFFKYAHANGASFFFISIYLHIARGFYYQSYSSTKKYIWITGVFIFLLMMATAFMGYVLPWGQMSFWGATVITNLFSAIPYVGESIANWLWGGFSVDNPTLNRFFSLHYLLPFIIVGLVLLHITLLHDKGSNNPLSINEKMDIINFYPYFVTKDLFIIWIFLIAFGYFVFFNPDYLGHPDNYIPANPLVTPPHIVPEWYFLIFYAILRAIPNKLGGVIAMFSSILILFFLPWFNKGLIRDPNRRPLHLIAYNLFMLNNILLGWLGAQPVEMPYLLLGQFCAFFYFFYLLILIPFIGYLENKILNEITKKNIIIYK